MEMEYIDYKTSEDRLGDYVHNPTKKELIEMLSKAILGGLLIGMVALAFSTVLTWKSVADKEYANAHAFIPVHRN